MGSLGICASPSNPTGEITSRLQKGGALIDDMRQLVCNWTNGPAAVSPLLLTGQILHKSTRARAKDTYRRAFLPRFINGCPPQAWRLAKELEKARPTIDVVKPFYYWITACAEPLLFRFVTESLFEKVHAGSQEIRIEDTIFRASIAMFGNTNQPVETMVRSSHLFAPMPEVIREDMAFLDRLHYYIPGWEVPKMRIEYFTEHYGFVVDYLAEAFRELRSHGFTEVIDRHFAFGAHLNARDVKAVRKTVSGLIKLLYPHGEFSKDELAELLELALEGRRRVKEQLKKMGAFEYHQTSFSYRDTETTEERYVGVPEEGGRAVISSDPLAPGSAYAASVNADGKVALCRIEVGVSAGTGKLRMAGGIDSTIRETVNRAFAFLQGHKVQMGIASIFDTTDFHVEAIDLLANRLSCEGGIALGVAIVSAIKKTPVLPGLVILGDLSIQGNIKALYSLAEPLQVAMENGARRALIPLENKRNFLEVSGDIVEKVDPIFYGDPMTAAAKALGLGKRQKATAR